MNDTIKNFETCTYVDFDNIDSDDDEFDENNKEFESKNQHINVIDKKRKSGVFSCDDCDKSFDLKSSLTKHVRTIHKKSYNCT